MKQQELTRVAKDLKEAASPQDDREMREVLQSLPFLSLEDMANDAHESVWKSPVPLLSDETNCHHLFVPIAGLDDAAPNSVLHVFSPPRRSIPLVQPSSHPRSDSSLDCQKQWVKEESQEM